jgi:hypothetical protein
VAENTVLVATLHLERHTARAALVGAVKIDMGGVEIDQRLGVPSAIGKQIFGAQPAVDIGDLVIRVCRGKEAGEIDLPVGVLPAPSA